MGNTQQKLKARMQQHFNEVQKLVKLGKKSDSCAKHFATQFDDTNRPQPSNGEEQPAASSGKAIQSVWSKLSLAKTAPCTLKKELQF